MSEERNKSGPKPLDPNGEIRSVRLMINLTPSEAEFVRRCVKTPHDLLLWAAKMCKQR